MLRRLLLSLVLVTAATAANATVVVPTCGFGCEEGGGGVILESAGDSFAIAFDGRIKHEAAPGLGAIAHFLVIEFDGAAGRVVLEITLSNTTDPERYLTSRVSALSFDLEVTLASESMYRTAEWSEAPATPSVKRIDVCATAQPKHCGGGVHPGAPGSFTLTLELEAPLQALSLSQFAVRYEDVKTSDGVVLGSGIGCGRVVPEPRLVALLGVAGLALLGRRRA